MQGTNFYKEFYAGWLEDSGLRWQLLTPKPEKSPDSTSLVGLFLEPAIDRFVSDVFSIFLGNECADDFCIHQVD